MLAPKILALFLYVAILNDFASAQQLPQAYQGVWEVTKVVDNGVEYIKPADPEVGLNEGEFDFMEIIIQENRLVMVQFDGQAGVGEIEIAGANRTNGIKVIELSITGFHSNPQPGKAFLQKTGDQIKLSMVQKVGDCESISEKAGDQQYVITAARRGIDFDESDDANNN